MKYKMLVEHVHPRFQFFLAGNLVLGVLQSAVEAAFALSLQLFIFGLGVSSDGGALPGWIPKLGVSQVVILLSVLLALRAVVFWAQSYAKESCGEQFRDRRRHIVAERSFRSESLSLGQAISVFNAFTFWAGDLVVRLLAFAQCVGTMAGLVAVLLFSSWKLFVFGNVLMLALAPLYLKLNSKILRESRSTKNSWQEIVSFHSSQLKNLTFLAVSGTADLEITKIFRRLEDFRERSLGLRRLRAASFPMIQLVGALAMCLILVVSHEKEILTGVALIAFMYLFSRYVAAIANALANYSDCVFLFPYFEQLQQIASSAEREAAAAIPELIDEEARLASQSSAPGWRLSRLTFRYPETTSDLFRELTLEIAAGRWTAISGPSGAGKSTLLRILLGQLRAASGAATISWEQTSRESREVASLISLSSAYVGTDPFLFEGSLAENLCYGLRRPVSSEEMLEALSVAHADFVEGLAGRLEFRLDDQGSGLSAGEKQRLALARALLRQPRLLVLDEVSAHWDRELELSIFRRLKSLPQPMTIVSAGHRLDSISLVADRVYDLETGA